MKIVLSKLLLSVFILTGCSSINTTNTIDVENKGLKYFTQNLNNSVEYNGAGEITQENEYYNSGNLKKNKQFSGNKLIMINHYLDKDNLISQIDYYNTNDEKPFKTIMFKYDNFLLVEKIVKNINENPKIIVYKKSKPKRGVIALSGDDNSSRIYYLRGSGDIKKIKFKNKYRESILHYDNFNRIIKKEYFDDGKLKSIDVHNYKANTVFSKFYTLENGIKVLLPQSKKIEYIIDNKKLIKKIEYITDKDKNYSPISKTKYNYNKEKLINNDKK